MNNNLTYKKIKSIKRIKKTQKVYNFNVPGYENYVANGFVVHNCENHILTQNNNTSGKYFTIPNIISLAKEKNCQSISMSYNEPTLSYEFLIDLADKCKEEDIPFLLKTNAYVNKEPWKEICKVTSGINVDWKGSEDKFKDIAGVSSYVLQDRIREAYDYGVHLEVSIPLYYKDDDIEEEMNIVGEFLSSINSSIPVHILRISPSYRYSDFVFNFDNIEKAKSILSGYMKNIYEV